MTRKPAQQRRDEITAPSLPEALARVSSVNLTADSEITEALVAGLQLSDCDAERLNLRSSQFVAVDLLGCNLRALDAVDVMFEGCDFSGSDLSESRLTRVEFRECRLSGVELPRSILRDVRLTDCKFDRASLRMSEGERVWVLDSNMRQADLYGLTLRSSRLLGCDLSETEFAEADLKGTQMQRSQLHGAKGVGGLYGILVDPDQALLISKLLLEIHGISVADAPEPR